MTEQVTIEKNGVYSAPAATAHLPAQDAQRQRAIRTVQITHWVLEHWIILFSVAFGVMMILPFFAPLFMSLGWEGPARLIYSMYSVLCHQMAQRSFFLFGQQQPLSMYNINQLPLTVSSTNSPVDMETLRAFIGNATLGWKVAWSDRMVYMYVAFWVSGMAYGILRRQYSIRPLSLLGFVLFLMPMGIDGGTHFLSDLTGGLNGGFRYDNQWLAALTGNLMPSSFYVGDSFGTFNSWVRLFTGLCFGIGVAWFMFPRIDEAMRDVATELREKLVAAGQKV